jgi:hypothetical protein
MNDFTLAAVNKLMVETYSENKLIPGKYSSL